MSPRLHIIVGLLSVLTPPLAWSAPPRLAGLNPPAVQRGVESRLQLYGKDLDPAGSLVLPFAAEVKIEGGGTDGVNTVVTPDPATLPGVYPLRLRTRHGLSNLRLLVVTDIPVVRVQEPNGRYVNGRLDLAAAQPVPVPCVIAGNRLERDIDAYRFTVHPGDRLTFVTQNWRVGLTPDPLLRLLDPRGKILTYAHDTPTLQRDERIDRRFTSGGEHVLELQSTGGGGWNNHYLVRIGPDDYARRVFPMGGRRGARTEFQVTNRDGVVTSLAATVPADPGCEHWLLPLPQHPGSLPWRLACGDLPEVFEAEDHAAAQPLAWPVTVNGRIAEPGEQDLYALAVVPGQRVRVTVEAYHLYSPLDGCLLVYDPVAQKLIAQHDDVHYRGNPDPALDFEVPADCREVVVALRDTLNEGSPAHAYRLSVEAGGPDFLLALGLMQNPTNEEDVGWHRMDLNDTLTLTPGRETQLRLSVRRSAKEDDPHYHGPVQGYTGPITVMVENLPAGVQVAPLVIPAGAKEAELVFTTTDAAPVEPFEIRIVGTGVRTDGTTFRRLAERRLFLSDPALPNLPWNWRVQKVTCVTTRL